MHPSVTFLRRICHNLDTCTQKVFHWYGNVCVALEGMVWHRISCSLKSHICKVWVVATFLRRQMYLMPYLEVYRQIKEDD